MYKKWGRGDTKRWVACWAILLAMRIGARRFVEAAPAYLTCRQHDLPSKSSSGTETQHCISTSSRTCVAHFSEVRLKVGHVVPHPTEAVPCLCGHRNGSTELAAGKDAAAMMGKASSTINDLPAWHTNSQPASGCPGVASASPSPNAFLKPVPAILSIPCQAPPKSPTCWSHSKAAFTWSTLAVRWQLGSAASSDSCCCAARSRRPADKGR